jgi:alkanesulfonate monooxygenase SsuD/methylene tetrahydromethanopterin reductase-like flavin-dependent oxidoreductase (luciferase family)
MSGKPIPFGVMLQGAGAHMNSWRHPSGPADASVNLDFYVESARKAEAVGIAFAFVADGLYINEKTIPHFLNR